MHPWFGRRGKLARGFIIALGLIFILVEWITGLLAGAIHSLIARLGLVGFEAYMRGLPLWCVVPITLVVAGGYASLEFAQFALIAAHHYVLAALSHVLKWLTLPILSYIWRLYDQRLLKYAWVRVIYGMYTYTHELIVGWVHRQEWYGRAIEAKDRYLKAARHHLASAGAAFRKFRTALRRRNTMLNAARRLKRFRLRRS